MDIQNLKSILANLSSDQKSEISTFLQNLASTDLLQNLTESRFHNGLFCPKCGCTENIVKFGQRNNIQRFKCKNCNRIFNSITNSTLMGTKKPLTIWKNYIECMLNGFSIRKSAQLCNINQTTAFIWRHKILDAISIKQEKDTKLKGIIEVDETFYTISYKGSRNLPREPHHRGTKASKRGISNEQVCIPCAIDRNNTTYGKISNLGKASSADISKVFKDKIENNSILCTDKNASYRKFAQENQHEHIEIKSGKYRNGIYHINHINAYHSALKNFIGRFKGIATKYLNNYIVWKNLMKMGIDSVLEWVVRSVCLLKYKDFKTRAIVFVE